jgi:uncharacterized protein (TIGR03083 family)
MDRDVIWRHIDTQRAAAAEILEGLTEEQWAQPSLCDAWTIRDVAAHLTFAQVRLREILLPVLRAGFRSNVMVRDTALRSPLSHSEIIAKLRSFIGTRQRAPFVSEREPLIDILVHTQDICVPLGIDHEPPSDAATTSIERIIQLNTGPFRLRPPLRDVRLVATDADWWHGDGRVVEGPIKWLLLAVAGRDVAREHLSGEVTALA